jgi:hypothetical protein
VRFTSGRWWKPLTARTPEEAQLSPGRFLAGPGDARERRTPAGARTTVGELAGAEPLLPLPPVPFPATISVGRIVAANATVAFRGNHYPVPPGLTGTTVSLRHRLSATTMEVHTAAGALPGAHRLAPSGAGTVVRTTAHRTALEEVVLSAFTTARPCNARANRPPGPEALAEGARLLGPEGRDVTVSLQADVTVSLQDYADLVEGTA